MQSHSETVKQKDSSSMVRTSVSPHSCCSGSPSKAGIADMLDDSYWQDLPDLAEHSSSDSLSAKLFSTDLGDLPFISLDHDPMATSGLDKNMFPSEKFSDFLFQGEPHTLADMDIASALTDANDFSLDTAPDKQLQPGTPSGQMNHMCDLLLQSYPPRSHTPISKDTGPLPFAGQASTAMVSCCPCRISVTCETQSGTNAYTWAPLHRSQALPLWAICWLPCNMLGMLFVNSGLVLCRRHMLIRWCPLSKE